MSSSDITSYFTTGGVLAVLSPTCPTIDATVNPEDSFPGFCRSGAMIQYGSLGVFRFLCAYANIPTPVLNSVTSSQGAFGNCLRRISEFYSDPKGDKQITAEDAFHLLRLHIHGGGLRRWKDGLRSGIFLSQDGVVLGKTEPKSAIHLEMTEKGRWERPPWLHSFSSEMTKVCDRICALNLERIFELCEDVDSPYQRQSRFINHIINLAQVSIMAVAVDHITSHGGTDVETTPSTYKWRGIPAADSQLFEELEREFSKRHPSLPPMLFGPMALPPIATAPVTPFTKASVFASLGKRKTMDPLEAVPGP